MANGSACSSSRLVSHDLLQPLSWPRRVAGSKMKPMPPPDMPPSIQKPQKRSPNSRAPARSASRCRGCWPRDDGLDRAVEVARGGAPMPRRRPRAARHDLVEDAHASCRPCHSASERSRYFSVTISRIGPDVLRHAAVHQHEAVLQRAARVSGETSSGPRMRCGQQAAAADAVLGVAFGRGRPGSA
jgi:hypothetical protein